LQGDLPDSIGLLRNLQTLELQGNMLTTLPDTLQELVNLHVLNVGDNKLASLNTALSRHVPLRELFAPKNLLEGTCFGNQAGHPTIQVLNLSTNNLSALGGAETIDLPSLTLLDVSCNRLNALPDMAACMSLVTLRASENSIDELPQGFIRLQSLRHVDVTSNNITTIDPEVARMENLESFLIAANPIRDRKYLTMDTEELKRNLRAKLEPADTADLADPDAELNSFEDADTLTTLGQDVGSNKWILKPGAMLDLSKRDITELSREDFSTFASAHSIVELNLQYNRLSSIPLIIAASSQTLSVLNLSNNAIAVPLIENLHLPALRELRLANNTITTLQLEVLLVNLRAGRLEHIDLTYNRLTGALPTLRSYFPSLTILSASENSIESVSQEALDGLRRVDLSNNSIERLEPRIGLLQGTLLALNVEGNKFRVPGFKVLQMGIEKVLDYLRNRIPADELQDDPLANEETF
jgi:Leucine-rich repeat (LRR) protein